MDSETKTADSETKTADSETDADADSEIVLRKLKLRNRKLTLTQIPTLRFGNYSTRMRKLKAGIRRRRFGNEHILSLWTMQINVKFHGVGDFDIILSLWTVQVNVGVGILISSYPCGQCKSM